MSANAAKFQGPVVFYVADPMCSWCWGFAPVVEAVVATFHDRLPVSVVLGGLRPGTRDPVTAPFRAEILHHWREVQRLTGQPFTFAGALPDGFVYDTEPASRAVLTIADLKPDDVLRYLQRTQEAFYVEQQDVTQSDALAALSSEFGIERERFLARFGSEAMRERTSAHFTFARQLGVRGFPTVLLARQGNVRVLTSGYRPFHVLRPLIETWLAEAPAA